MTTENYSNDAVTSLAASCGPSDTNIQVTNATGFPAVNFRIVIDDEIILVTGVSGTSWTVTRAQESTTAVAHSLGATAANTLTVAGLSALITSLGGGGSISTTISTSAPLTGGGPLSENLTLSISPATDSTAGSLSAADKTKIDGLGTASTHASTDFDASGSASTAQTNAETFATNAITSLNLGTASTHASTDFILSSTLGAASGTATLDGSGHLTSGQIPSALVGAVVYQGTWNATTNSPTITSSTGTKGNYYVVATAGTTSIDSIAVWNAGDTIIFNGTVWDKIDGTTDEVISFNSRYGVVSPQSGDYTASQVGLGNVSNNLQLTVANNLSDLNSASTARTNLGLGTAATHASTDFISATTSQTQNQVLASPNGSSGDLSVRALVASDLPSITLGGDLSGTTGSATVATVDGSSAANVHAAELLANAATNANTQSTIVKRDTSGNFSAGTITGTLSGNATNVSGTVAIANGGTGQTTQNAALVSLLPTDCYIQHGEGIWINTGNQLIWATVSSGSVSSYVSNLYGPSSGWVECCQSNASTPGYFLTGALALNLVSKTTAYQTLKADTYIGCTSSGGLVVTLVDYTTCKPGQMQIVFDLGGTCSSTNTITITPTSGQKINGSTTSFVINQAYGSVELITDGANSWYTAGFSQNAVGEVSATHFLGSGATPTVAVGAAAGTGGSVGATMTGATNTDASMQVTVVTGSSAGSSGALFTVTFGTAFANAPNATYSPANATAALTINSKALNITTTTTTLSINANAAVGTGSTLIFNIKT